MEPMIEHRFRNNFSVTIYGSQVIGHSCLDTSYWTQLLIYKILGTVYELRLLVTAFI